MVKNLGLLVCWLLVGLVGSSPGGMDSNSLYSCSSVLLSGLETWRASLNESFTIKIRVSPCERIGKVMYKVAMLVELTLIVEIKLWTVGSEVVGGRVGIIKDAGN